MNECRRAGNSRMFHVKRVAITENDVDDSVLGDSGQAIPGWMFHVKRASSGLASGAGEGPDRSRIAESIRAR